MTRLGLPCQGGKSKLADWIIDLFPKATHFYDLFCGGCSVTHAALLSGKFEHVHANDITDSVKLFEDSLNADLDIYDPSIDIHAPSDKERVKKMILKSQDRMLKRME